MTYVRCRSETMFKKLPMAAVRNVLSFCRRFLLCDYSPSIIPVSYTHLDVYKRQSLGSGSYIELMHSKGWSFYRCRAILRATCSKCVLQVKPEVLNNWILGQGSITYVESVGEPSASGEDCGCVLSRVDSDPPFLCPLNVGVKLLLGCFGPMILSLIHI